MAINNKIHVEVVYATPAVQRIWQVEIAAESTIEDVIEASGVLDVFPEIDLTKQKVGIFSQQKNLEDEVKEGDRVEIYRPLTMDPKEARKKRATKRVSPRR